MEFDSEDAAKNALGLSDKELDGRKIRVDMAGNKKDRHDRGGYHKSYRGGDRDRRKGGFDFDRKRKRYDD